MVWNVAMHADKQPRRAVWWSYPVDPWRRGCVPVMAGVTYFSCSKYIRFMIFHCPDKLLIPIQNLIKSTGETRLTFENYICEKQKNNIKGETE
jgi:hypothetical protein